MWNRNPSQKSIRTALAFHDGIPQSVGTALSPLAQHRKGRHFRQGRTAKDRLPSRSSICVDRGTFDAEQRSSRHHNIFVIFHEALQPPHGHVVNEGAAPRSARFERASSEGAGPLSIHMYVFRRASEYARIHRALSVMSNTHCVYTICICMHF